jgi:hypothetical protein
MDEQLKALMGYTTFHIGLYTTLCTLLVSTIGLSAFGEQADKAKSSDGVPRITAIPRMEPLIPCLLLTLICFAVAGIFGGLVGSSLPAFKTWSDFEAAWLGPWFMPHLIRAPWAASAEHTAFWLGTVIALVSVVWTYMVRRPRGKPSPTGAPATATGPA